MGGEIRAVFGIRNITLSSVNSSSYDAYVTGVKLDSSFSYRATFTDGINPSFDFTHLKGGVDPVFISASTRYSEFSLALSSINYCSYVILPSEKVSSVLSVNGEVLTEVGSLTLMSYSPRVKIVDVSVEVSKSDNFNSLCSSTTFNTGGYVKIDSIQVLNYGYSVDNFLIGGVFDSSYKVEEAAILFPPTGPIQSTEKVIRIVNIVNVVVLPERTVVDFENLTLASDVDSMAWVATFDISSINSFNAMKPTGLAVKEVEISINGDIFVVFIGRTSVSKTAGSNGVINKSMRCVGWSNVKRLTYPYHPRRSYTLNSQSTPAGIIFNELSGTGFTGLWGSVSWVLPTNSYGYIDKSPLAAIVELAGSVGGIIIPGQSDNSLTIQPRYPISPWNWDISPPDRVLNESSFFSINSEWIPQEAPDSVYVYGQEGGVGVKCVRQGTAGLVTLPTIVDKHITDTIAGAERGRIEVAKNGFKEEVPITTYVEGSNSIVKPLELVQVNDTQGGYWKGLAIRTSISIAREGTGITQSLTIERFHV